MEETTSITDVLTGKKAVQVEVGISTQSIIFLCVGLLLVIAIGSFIHKNIQP